MSKIDILTTYLKNKIYHECKFVYNCTYRKLRGKIFIWADNSLSKNHRPQKMTPMPGIGLPLLSCQSWLFKTFPKHVRQAVTIALGYPTDVEGKYC